MIKELFDKNYIIVLDTNVLLNIYRYSPEFSGFAFNCLNSVKESIVLSAIVRLEYGKHCRGEFSKMEKRITNFGKETE
ncbi:PIN-like domain-containing protein [Lachnospiraceae bacterium 48-21]